MDIVIEWSEPIDLTEENEDFIYTCDIESLPKKPGIYVFSRKNGNAVAPLYVGKAKNIQGRIQQQFNNLKLMGE